jgi:hypothetical protein
MPTQIEQLHTLLSTTATDVAAMHSAVGAIVSARADDAKALADIRDQLQKMQDAPAAVREDTDLQPLIDRVAALNTSQEADTKTLTDAVAPVVVPVVPPVVVDPNHVDASGAATPAAPGGMPPNGGNVDNGNLHNDRPVAPIQPSDPGVTAADGGPAPTNAPAPPADPSTLTPAPAEPVGDLAAPPVMNPQNPADPAPVDNVNPLNPVNLSTKPADPSV